MRTIAAFMRRHDLVTFVVLTYALSWSLSLFEPHSLLGLGPLLAALIVLSITAGRGGVTAFLRRIVAWRVSPRWYLLVLGLPPALFALALGLNLLLGAAAPHWERLPPLAELPVLALFILLTIAVGEEPAWRGFALPRLIAGRSALAGSLLLWLVHALWHLPLFGLEFTAQNIVPWLMMLLGGTLIYTWVYHRTNGNLLLPVLFHTAVNLFAKYLFHGLFDGADALRLWWLLGSLWLLMGLTIVVATGRELGREPAQTTQAMLLA